MFDLLCFIFAAVTARFRQYHNFCVNYFLNTVVTDDNFGVSVDSNFLLEYFFGFVVLILNGGVVGLCLYWVTEKIDHFHLTNKLTIFRDT